MSLKLFRYSGNKSRLVRHYRKPPRGTKRIVELYLGSGAYFMSGDLPGVGYETNGDIVAMWKWLQRVTVIELRELYDAVEAIKVDYTGPGKPDVRLLNLPKGPETYVRINSTGVYTGQLTAWRIYPQHRLPLEQTIACLPKIRDMEVIHGSSSEYVHEDGDLLFVDPPYLGTTAGYNESGSANHEKGYDPRQTIEVLSRTSNPVIFTYGDGAASTFPDYEWQSVVTRKVPNIRRGGTVDRTEWVSYIQWQNQQEVM